MGHDAAGAVDAQAQDDDVFLAARLRFAEIALLLLQMPHRRSSGAGDPELDHGSHGDDRVRPTAAAVFPCGKWHAVIPAGARNRYKS